MNLGYLSVDIHIELIKYLTIRETSHYLLLNKSFSELNKHKALHQVVDNKLNTIPWHLTLTYDQEKGKIVNAHAKIGWFDIYSRVNINDYDFKSNSKSTIKKGIGGPTVKKLLKEYPTCKIQYRKILMTEFYPIDVISHDARDSYSHVSDIILGTLEPRFASVDIDKYRFIEDKGNYSVVIKRRV